MMFALLTGCTGQKEKESLEGTEDEELQPQATARQRLGAGEALVTEEILELLKQKTEGSAPVEACDLEESKTAKDNTENPSTDDEYSNLAIADVNNYVNVRSAPDVNSEILGKMYDGAVAQVQEKSQQEDGEWFKVISGAVEGYIKAEFFIYGDEAAKVIDDYVTRYAVVRADRLNVRKEPDINAKRIGYIDNGEKLPIVEYGEEWTKIQYTDEEQGYAASQYITVEEQFIYAKSIEEEKAMLEAERLLMERAQQNEEAAPENVSVSYEPPPTAYNSNAELRQAIVQYAMQYLGVRYVHGGRSLSTGTDCSGFTSYVYGAFGYPLSRTPQGQWGSNGRSIDVSQIQPGDIVCYSSNGSKCTHVAIYIGDGQIIHEANAKKGTVISDIYYDKTFIGVKNVID